MNFSFREYFVSDFVAIATQSPLFDVHLTERLGRLDGPPSHARVETPFSFAFVHVKRVNDAIRKCTRLVMGMGGEGRRRVRVNVIHEYIRA